MNFLCSHSTKLVENISIPEIIRIYNDNDNDKKKKRRRPVWIHLTACTFEEASLLLEILPIHPLTILMATKNAIEKEFLMQFEKYVYLLLHTVIEKDEEDRRLDVHQIHLLLFNDVVVTIQSTFDYGPQTNKDNDNLANVLAGLRGLDYDFPTADWIPYALIAGNKNIYSRFVLSVSQEAEDLDGDVLQQDQTTEPALRLLQRIRDADARLSFLYWFMHAKLQVLLSLQHVARTQESFHFPYLSQHDITASVIHLRYRLQVSREALDNGRETYLNMVSLEYAESSGRQNKTMQVFSAIATTTMPMLMVTTVFSMNVPVAGGWNGGADKRNYDVYSVAVAALLLLLSLSLSLTHIPSSLFPTRTPAVLVAGGVVYGVRRRAVVRHEEDRIRINKHATHLCVFYFLAWRSSCEARATTARRTPAIIATWIPYELAALPRTIRC